MLDGLHVNDIRSLQLMKHHVGEMLSNTKEKMSWNVLQLHQGDIANLKPYI
jgi:hypothetical protein